MPGQIQSLETGQRLSPKRVVNAYVTTVWKMEVNKGRQERTLGASGMVNKRRMNHVGLYLVQWDLDEFVVSRFGYLAKIVANPIPEM
jgi:alkylated DNA nucleotide flippase Atl1